MMCPVFVGNVAVILSSIIFFSLFARLSSVIRKATMVLKFCANLSFLYTENDNLLGRYVLASKAGFKAVECAFPYDFPAEEVAKVKNDNNVEQILINAYPGNVKEGELGFAALPGKVESFKSSLERSIEYCKTLNCKRLHIMSGKSLSGIIDTAMDDVYKDNLLYAASRLESEGIIGLVEPISNYAVPNYFMNSFSKGLQIVREIDSKWLNIQLDIFHLQILEGNLTNNIKELLPFTGHIQISQVPGRNEPDAKGEIDYHYILQLLEQQGYEGYIGLEYRPSTTTEESLGWISKWGYCINN